MTEPDNSPMKAIRTYPQPDSPKLGSSPRNRALAVFKYLLNIEPEQARGHPMFLGIQHAFMQEGTARINGQLGAELDGQQKLEESIIPELKPGEIPLAFRKA